MDVGLIDVGVMEVGVMEVVGEATGGGVTVAV